MADTKEDHTDQYATSEWMDDYSNRDIAFQAQQIIDKSDDIGALYLSNIQVAHNAKDLMHLQIKYVLTVTHDKSLSEKVPLNSKDCKFHIAINDKVEDETIKAVNSQFPMASQWIHGKLTGLKGNTLVHCSSGISRSSAVIIWYLMSFHEMNLKSAFEHVFNKRPVILPNDALFSALQQKDIQLFGKLSMDKNCYHAFSLCSMLRFLNINLKQCQNALVVCNYNVMDAAQMLQQQNQ
eukprot:6510_1